MRNFLGASACFARRGLELVLARVGVGGEMPDIGDVDDLLNRVSPGAESAAQHVSEDVGPEVAYMLAVIDSGPAVIGLDHSPQGLECAGFSRERVVEPACRL